MDVRMRQICLVAQHLAPAVDALTDVFGLTVCHRDPGVGKYGLENALFAVGNGFLEVVAPVRGGTAAGRFLDRRGGDGGYMVITQCADVAARRARCERLGVRVANHIRYPDYEEIQLHPRDVGAAMLSFSCQAGGEAPDGPWHPAGTARPAARRARIAAMVGAELQGDDPERLARRWSEVLELPVVRDDGRPVIRLDDARLSFVPAADGRGDGLGGLEVTCADPAGVRAAAQKRGLLGADGVVTVCGVRFSVQRP